MRSEGEPPTFEPGLTVHQLAAPHDDAPRLATDLDAVLCTTRGEADEHIASCKEIPLLDPASIDALRGAARRLAAARRIVAATLDRAAAEVGERLAATGTGVAVHPSAVRDRAAAVLTARQEVVDAEDALRAHQAQVDAAAAARAAVREAEVADWELVPAEGNAAPARRGRRRSLLGWLRGSSDQGDSDDTGEVSSLLRQVAETTDEAFGARRAAAARDDQLVLRRAQRDRALEDLRVAERAWRDLAGDDPVEAVEEVVRRFDPQHQGALAIARDTAGVRAVERLLADAEANWTQAWASAGHETPPVDDPAALDDLVRSATRAVVLVGAATERAEDLARAAPAAVVVVVEGA